MASYSFSEIQPVLGCSQASSSSLHLLHPEMKARPQSHPQQALRCPRCDSSNTKFCYYNNYSLSQPRYFCKGCRRYWTKGGSLRNVPVGGGCRKNKRSYTSSSTSSSPPSSFKKSVIPSDHQLNFTIPSLSYEPCDISFPFSGLQDEVLLLGNLNPSPNPNPSHAFLEILRSGFVGSTNPASPAITGLENLCYGISGGDNGDMLHFNHGLSVSNSTDAAPATTGHGSNYWNGAGSISWNSGFINGYPHEIHHGV